jgi:hypothetical protein
LTDHQEAARLQTYHFDKIDVTVVHGCWTLLCNFQSALKIYNKFDRLWTKLEIQNYSIQKDVDQKLKKTAWMMYIWSKHALFEGVDLYSASSLPDCVLLIISILHLVATNSNHLGDSAEVKMGLYDIFKRQQLDSPPKASEFKDEEVQSEWSQFALSMLMKHAFSSQNIQNFNDDSITKI